MNLPWLLLQYRALERMRLQELYDRQLASGTGAVAATGGDAARVWSRGLSKLENQIRKVR